MTRLRLLADDNMPGVDACCARLRAADGQPVALDIRRVPGRGLTAADVADTDILLVRSITRVNAALLAGSPVRFVGTATIGTDHLDTDWLTAEGIAWASAPGCNARAVAEWVLATLLRQAVHQPISLAGRTLGIIGLGHVGREVARLLRALGMAVVACDPLLRRADLPADLQDIPLLSLDELLAAADIITVHTPLTRVGAHATAHLLDGLALARLRPDAWLINASRGAVVDNAALRDALATGWLTAMLDVWEAEPVPDARLLAAVSQGSAHIAGHSLEGKWRGTWQIVAAAAREFGLTLDAEFADVLPADGAQRLLLAAAGSASDEARLAALLASVIDLAGDDERLRVARAAADPGAAFDRLRSHYPLRREFPAHTVHGETADFAHDPLRSVLIALGFCC